MRSTMLSSRALTRLAVIGIALIPLGMASCATGTEPSTERSDAPSLDGLLAPESQDVHETLLQRYRERLERSPNVAFKGVVTGLDGKPIEGVTVRVADQETKTDASGAYSLPQVEVGSYVVSFDHPHYVFAQRRLTIELGDSAWLTQELLPRSKSQHFDADSGAIVKEGRLTLEFEPQDLEVERDHSPVHGDIEVVMTAIDPRKEGHISAAPAELEGITTTGEQVGLFSYGMLEVELFHNGQRVNVRRGETVTASLDVTVDQSLPEGAKIPMWHHNTTTGIWVQEAGADAVVEAKDSVRVAVAQLPHFSAWNWDVPADGDCAPLVVPSTMNVSRVRVISTDASGNVVSGYDANNHPQGWSISFDCATATGRSSRCAVNVPAGSGWSGGNAYFKLQVQQSGTATWCDLTLALNGSTGTVWSRNDVNQYLTNNGLTGGSWCGNQYPNGGWVNGTFDFTLSQYTLPTTRIAFGTPLSSSNCAASVGAQAVTNDSGFATMASRAATLATAGDYDNDGVADRLDKCIANRNANQTDSSPVNGIGDNCEAICYIPPGDPYASWYDADGDGVDDYCDNNWTTYNPSQY